MLAGGVAIGGVPGILLGFTAALVALDRLLDRVLGSPTHGMAEARDAFDRLARERRAAERSRRGRTAPDGGLAYLPEDHGWAAVAPRRRLGVEAIPLDSIVGTVERHKAATFDAAFRPPDFSRERWAQLYAAVERGAELPPISVYRVGDQHVVRDGHHRVSVLRALGVVEVQADVIELHPPAGQAARVA